MTTVVFSLAFVAAAIFALAALGERRRRADFGRLSKRQLLKYR